MKDFAFKRLLAAGGVVRQPRSNCFEIKTLRMSGRSWDRKDVIIRFLKSNGTPAAAARKNKRKAWKEKNCLVCCYKDSLSCSTRMFIQGEERT